jgi:hypothetical protein
LSISSHIEKQTGGRQSSRPNVRSETGTLTSPRQLTSSEEGSRYVLLSVGFQSIYFTKVRQPRKCNLEKHNMRLINSRLIKLNVLPLFARKLIHPRMRSWLKRMKTKGTKETVSMMKTEMILLSMMTMTMTTSQPSHLNRRFSVWL